MTNYLLGVIGELRITGRLQVEQFSVQDVEAEPTHIRYCDLVVLLRLLLRIVASHCVASSVDDPGRGPLDENSLSAYYFSLFFEGQSMIPFRGNELAELIDG